MKQTMKTITYCFTVSLLIVTSACTLQYPVVGIAKNYNEVFNGTVTANIWTGHGYIEGRALVSKVKCAGPGKVTYVPQTGNVSGQMGVVVLTCEDGRAINATYTITSHAQGFGVGKDQYGNEFTFNFGMSDLEAAARVNEYLKTAATRQPLPSSRPQPIPSAQPQPTQQTEISKPQDTQKPQQSSVGLGTGFFVTSNGYLVTNNHVIEGASSVVILLYDGNAVRGQVVRTDPANDLALIKTEVNAKPLQVRDTGTLAVGEDVFTIGYPLPSVQGADQKTTFGRINALSGLQGDIRLVQIDVPVQPGNSGGPLVDSRGRVVGIVTARLDELAVLKASGSLPQNVNYAVKSDYLFPILRTYTQGNWRQISETAQSQDLPSVVKIVQPSVALVIAK